MVIIKGGVKSSMYRDLPSPLVAEFGFQVQFSKLLWAWIYKGIMPHAMLFMMFAR